LAVWQKKNNAALAPIPAPGRGLHRNTGGDLVGLADGVAQISGRAGPDDVAGVMRLAGVPSMVGGPFRLRSGAGHRVTSTNFRRSVASDFRFLTR